MGQLQEGYIYHLSEIPTKSQYVDALRSLCSKNKLNDLQLAILSAQYWAPDHTAGAAELGKVVGYHLAVVNGQYGRLGHLIADEIGFKPDQREIGTYRWWAVLAEGWYDSENRFIWRMHQEVALALEELGWMQHKAEHISEEVTVPDNLIEGAVRQITVNSYERNPMARKKCIEHYGTTCCICGFDFEAVYGPLGKDYTNVHHLKPLSDINETYQVDPVNDLCPVCPNCHAMIHRKNPPLTIEQVKGLLATYGHK
jgi:5-methylcytosine-specific restriction protein A